MWMRRMIVVAGAAVMALLALPGVSARAADAPKPAAAKPAAPAAAKPPTAAKPPATAKAPAAVTAPVASGEMPGKYADFWTFWPKAGHVAEFEAAVKAHLAWRKQAHEAFVWEAYQPIVGTDLTRYVYRSGQHHWVDFDAQQAWEMSSKAGEAFARDVQPLIEHYVHTMEEEDYADSHWVENPDYRYFWVEDHKLRPGMGSAVSEATAKIHKGLEAGGWTGSYAIAHSIGGLGGLMVIFPYKSYADMEDPKIGFMEVLTKGLGSPEAAKAAVQQFDDGLVEVNTTIYLLRPDLSTPK